MLNNVNENDYLQEKAIFKFHIKINANTNIVLKKYFKQSNAT